ncbi:MAG: hypothetical protein KDC46_09860 [Thermoleophilia bacterium]|nr:hypothetical protein [Thermoleophilia bacterium]
MLAATKLGIGAGAALAVGTAVLAKITYDDAAHNRNNDRNAIINMAFWGGTVGAGAASIAAHRFAKGAAPWLYGATALLGANAFAGAAAMESGWERSGIAYCRYGFCNRTAGDRYGAPSIWVGRDNPLDGVDVAAEDRAAG